MANKQEQRPNFMGDILNQLPSYFGQVKVYTAIGYKPFIVTPHLLRGLD